MPIAESAHENEFLSESSTMVGKAAREKLVLIGNGMAGMRTIEELLVLDPAGYFVVTFSNRWFVIWRRL